jgi:hypothetical protein
MIYIILKSLPEKFESELGYPSGVSLDEQVNLSLPEQWESNAIPIIP